MNIPKHTPGPWHVLITSRGHASIEHHNGIGMVELADVAAPCGLDRAHADARLMAAAPEMRQQLDQVQQDRDELCSACKSALALLWAGHATSAEETLQAVVTKHHK